MQLRFFPKFSHSSRCFRVPPFVVPRWHENLSWASNARGHTRCVQRYVLGLHDESPQQKQCWHSSVKQKQIGGWFKFKYTASMLIIHPNEVYSVKQILEQDFEQKTIWHLKNSLLGDLNLQGRTALMLNSRIYRVGKSSPDVIESKPFFFVWGGSNAQCHKSLTGTCPCCAIRFDIDTTPIYLCLKNIKNSAEKTTFLFSKVA